MTYQVDLNTEALSKRLEDIGTTLYQISKRIAEIKGSGTSVTYHTTTSKAIEEPLKSKLSTILEIIEALGGRAYIEWDDVESLDKEEYFIDQRIDKLEKSMEEMKTLLLQLVNKQ
ncbi:hypothetical protein [Trichormus variabilis]|uniref:Uncharacterized protein n=1 Tax=Trichormus variabilis SAG 1403-4b TaxID=447716 RepID=A0A433UGG1_ANAVA|nr:hypothetical protein [Trichormus variabilis]MBD2629670.1 hypothetical protein [Trichormus variabilis FACHB-164]RUS92912.1 hypothetical protein DSM107003_46590 [Trichormus variabilis SAG 1403-4b]